MQQVQETFPKQGWIRSCFCVFVTYSLHSALLSACTGKASADVNSQRITAFLDETVLLPCSIPPSQDLPTVEWSKEGVSPNTVFVYRDGCETFEEKNPDFRYRTSLIMNELQNGNLSLRVSNLQLSDKGTYWCKIVQGQQPEVLAKLELDVVAVSEPKLSVVSYDRAEITVQCEVECWLPEPEITFLDEQHNEITAKKPQRCLHSEQCPCITRTAIVQTATNRVTCRVHERQFNMTKIADISISDYNKSPCFISNIIYTVVTMILTFGVFGLAFLLYKKLNCNVRGKHSSQKTEDEVQKTTAASADSTTTKNLPSLRDSRSSDDQPNQNNSKPAATSNQINSIETEDPKQAASDQHPAAANPELKESGQSISPVLKDGRASSVGSCTSASTSEDTNVAGTTKSQGYRHRGRPLSILSIKSLTEALPEESKPLID
ncbi:butyrophilin subfamily 3 member A2-like [Cololabis saira]|uniref:butyrophilin subfamily 3 member A2-like n=1 Tax=Cololabis saira TaxID=129043 RepID=UPI002AD231BB|nr:butyrophilin subfamily 3 member A2-like [Cololabis saira]